MGQTEQNLMTLFVKKSMDRVRYNMFAQKAHSMGLYCIAKYFDSVAINELTQAKILFDKIESTKLNFSSVVEIGNTQNIEHILEWVSWDKNELWSDIYPSYHLTAINEGREDIARIFTLLSTIEKQHEEHFRSLLCDVKNNQINKKPYKVIWKCSNCGMQHQGVASPEYCPLCSSVCFE